MSPLSRDDSVIAFADGIPGFEACREYVLVASPAVDPFAVLQGRETGAPSFVAIDPRRVVAGYEAALDERARERLGVTGEPPLIWLSLVAIQGNGRATVNLRAPIVINPASMRGVQLLPADSPYAIDHPLELA